MKKTLVLFLMVCGIILTSSIQAKNLDNIDGVWQNKNNQSLTEIKDISESSDLNTNANLPRASILVILVIIGFFFAKKHLDIAKKHRDFTKKN